MPDHDNKAIVTRFYEEVLNKKNFAALDRHFHSEFVDNSPPIPGMPVPGNLDTFRRTIRRITAAYPDARFTCEDLIAEADRVVVRFRAAGTYKGAYEGISPTGKKITWTGVHIFRLANHRITEWWASVDTRDMARQLEESPGRPSSSKRMQSMERPRLLRSNTYFSSEAQS